MSGLSPEFILKLRQVLAENEIRTGDTVRLLDTGFHPKNLDADVMVFPKDTSAVAQVVTLCSEHAVGIVAQGGRTGLSGAARSTPGQLILSTAAMTSIESIDPLAATAIVQSGATLAELNTAASDHGLCAGIDLAARDTATLGGMASTNAGGIEAFRNGIMRHRVLGLEAVLADGSILSDMKSVIKANEGYDIKQLFMGAEGTLGIVTRLVLSLKPVQTSGQTVLAAFQSTRAAVETLARLRPQFAGELLCAEAMWRDYAVTVAADLGLQQVFGFTDAPLYVLFEFSSSEKVALEQIENAFVDELTADRVIDVVFAKNEREGQDIWRVREDSFAIDRQFPHGFWFDISVPLEKLDDYMTAMQTRVAAVNPELRVFAISHLADGNIHLTISSGCKMPEIANILSEAVYEGLSAMGGSFSAEHGIGTDKMTSLGKQANPAKLSLMSKIKQAFDPLNIMNPGKVLQS